MQPIVGDEPQKKNAIKTKEKKIPTRKELKQNTKQKEQRSRKEVVECCNCAVGDYYLAKRSEYVTM